MTIEIQDHPDRSRYEILVDGELAGLADYRCDGAVIDLPHTEIAEAFGGQGLASKLIAAVLDDARDRGLAVLPHCPFVRAYIAKHPDYLGLVPTERRAEFDLA